MFALRDFSWKNLHGVGWTLSILGVFLWLKDLHFVHFCLLEFVNCDFPLNHRVIPNLGFIFILYTFNCNCRSSKCCIRFTGRLRTDGWYEELLNCSYTQIRIFFISLQPYVVITYWYCSRSVLFGWGKQEDTVKNVTLKLFNLLPFGYHQLFIAVWITPLLLSTACC